MTYDEWRGMWDNTGGWRPTRDDMDLVLGELARALEVVDACVAEAEAGEDADWGEFLARKLVRRQAVVVYRNVS